jgi:hypothetical protein
MARGVVVQSHVAKGRPPAAYTILVAIASCRTCQLSCDGRRCRPKTKYEIGTTPAELTTATTRAHSHLGPGSGLLAAV